MYKNGKIYKLWSLEGDDIYIGSTCNSLERRLYEHKMCYKDTKISSVQLFQKYNKVKIELIEEYPCETKNELTRREGQVIRENKCVNKRIEGRTPKEHYDDNRDKILLKKQDYYIKNYEVISQKKKDYRLQHLEQYKQKDKEHYEQNIEKIKEQKKQKYQQNKEQISEKNKETMTCVCGCTVNKRCLSRHLKTEKHNKLKSIATI